jgi:titin
MTSKANDRRKQPRFDSAWYRDQRLASAVAMELAGLESRLLCCIDGEHYHPSPEAWPWADPYGTSAVHLHMGPVAPATVGPVMTNPLSSLPALNSNPGAPATLYLDFNGAAAQTWGGYNVTATPAFSQDGDVTTFSNAELAAIQQIWARVAEAYSPLNINVTTVDPGNLNNGQTSAVVIGGSSAWLGQGAGGVAYVGGFYNSAPNVSWVFPNNLGGGNAKYVADAAVHESGHTFGLLHQSAYSGTTKTAEYRAGTSSLGAFMGSSYYSSRAKWWYGQASNSYANYQDDLAILSNNTNGFGYRPDDHGDTLATADALTLSGATVTGAGVITTTADVDVFSFVTSAGQVSFTLSVAQYGAMLDATLKLVDTNNTIIAQSDTTNLGESVSFMVAEGSYRLVVSSKGAYGDVGQYSITGTIVPDPNYVAPPSNVTATSGAGGVALAWFDNAWNETGYTIERSDDGGQTWAPLADVADGVQAYLDAWAVVGQTYQYRLFAFNDTHQSGYSAALTVNVTPATPGSFTATSVSASRIDLAWADVDGESGFVIERSLNGTTWSALTTVAADQTTYSDTGLAAGTRYYYRVRASSAVGASANAAAVSTLTRVAQPALTLTVLSAGQINLLWTNVLGETGYRVERSIDNSTWSTLATPAVNATGYASVGLTAGTTYYYRVVAVNAAGDSAPGAASKTTLLTAPTGMNAAGVSTTQVNLTWNNSAGETGYVVERSLNNLAWTTLATLAADVTSYSNTNLVGGTQYYYRVRALNAGGTSLPSASSNAYTIPLAPVLSSVTAASDTQLTIRWTNVTGELSYVLQRSADGSTGWATIASPAANAVLYNNTGLTADTSYFYRIVAGNASGDSTASAAVAGRTLLPAVAGVTATGVSTTQVNLTWTDSTGESAYNVERSTNGTVWTLVTTTAADATSYSNTGLAAGTTYYYRVRAVNAGGVSLVTANASALTVPPGTTLTGAAASAMSIRLTWLNVLGESGYRIERSDDGSTDWTTLTTTVANAVTYLDSGLTTDTPYFYRVTALNASGDAAASAVKTTSTLLVAPTDLTATAPSPTQIDLAWDDSATETGYRIERSLNGTTWAAWANLAADVTSYSNTGLAAGTAYHYRVRALNAGGYSDPSVKAAAVTRPAALTVTGAAASTTQINVAWTNVLGETGYRVERSTDNATWSTLATRAANVATFSDTGLTADSLYYYRVTAYNASGDGASTVVSRRTLLPAPTGLVATPASTTSITLTWDPTTGETGYKIERFNGRTWALLATVAADVNTYTNTALLPGRAYAYRVRAVNAGGDSAPTAGVSATTPASAPVVRRAATPLLASAFQHKKMILDLLDAA